MNIYQPYLHRGIALIAFSFMSFVYATKSMNILLLPLAAILLLSSIGCLLSGNLQTKNACKQSYWLGRQGFIEILLSFIGLLAYANGWQVFELIVAIWIQSLLISSIYQVFHSLIKGLLKSTLLIFMIILFVSAFWLYPVNLFQVSQLLVIQSSIVIALAGLFMIVFYWLSPLKKIA